MSRHMNTGRKLSRNTSHRKALLRNLIRAVILEESIVTTTPKAKEARRVVEKIITQARVGNARGAAPRAQDGARPGGAGQAVRDRSVRGSRPARAATRG